MEVLTAKLLDLLKHRSRFTYDLRAHCQVYSGVVAAYRATQDSTHFTDLPSVMSHALAHDGIIGGWKNSQGEVQYDSCRLFTGVDDALRFARAEGQEAVYNINREQTIPVAGHT